MVKVNKTIQSQSLLHSKRLFSLIVYFPVIWLIYHLTAMLVLGDYEGIVLEEYVRYRAYFYQTYAIAFVIIGIIIMVEQHSSYSSQVINNEDLNNVNKKVSVVTLLLPRLVTSLILVTFAYSISDIIAEILLSMFWTTF